MKMKNQKISKPKNVETRRSQNRKIMKFENSKLRKPKDLGKIISNISKTPEDERISCLIFCSCAVWETWNFDEGRREILRKSYKR